jgi:hypothetical protein
MYFRVVYIRMLCSNIPWSSHTAFYVYITYKSTIDAFVRVEIVKIIQRALNIDLSIANNFKASGQMLLNVNYVTDV